MRNLTEIPIDLLEKHKAFLASNRQHILMITNHGLHQWQVIPGLPDTGGQNIYVNQLTQALAEAGFKITIANRGGYSHPNTGEWREGLHYKDEQQRLLYLQDSNNRFIRKEDMADRIPELVEYLKAFLDHEGTPIDLIISHYWDAAKLGVLYNQSRPEPVKHVWVPHSLGAIKKQNVSEDRWADLRIDERIEIEQKLIEAIDYFAAPSATIRTSLQDDYGCSAENILFLPPAIDTGRYHPRQVAEDNQIWDFLSDLHQLNEAELTAVADGWHEAIRAMVWLMPQLGREVAYNVLTHNGPGAGLYFEFLPYTQETGGFEHLGLFICQANPHQCAIQIRTFLRSSTQA